MAGPDEAYGSVELSLQARPPEMTPGDGRLWRLQVVERSVEHAKAALGEAEAAMRSVHAGLALEPLHFEPPVHVGVDSRLEPQSQPPRIFDPATLYRRFDLAQVPLPVLAAGLVVLGWLLALVLRTAIGSERLDSWVAPVRAPIVQAMTWIGDLRGMSGRGAGVDGQLPIQDPVVIYERTSPYTRYFAALSERERYCLAEAIYYEARGEPIAGQIAVAQVVLNRTLAGPWPKRICEVTHQGVENGQKCQFSYACMRRILTKPHGDAWDNAQGLSEEILAGGAWLEEMLDATHFHRHDLKPVWRLSLVTVGRVGRHIFYNSPSENRRPLSKIARRE